MNEIDYDKLQRGYIEVSLDHILFNMDQMHANLDPATQMIAVIKTDGYGHGAVPIAKELESLEYVWGYATATAEEALHLRKCGIDKPILILGYTFPYSYDELLKNRIRPAVFREDTLTELSEASKRTGCPARIHIKVDSGMSRIGIQPDEEGISLLMAATNSAGISIEGIFTHFAQADETDKTKAKKQFQTFRDFVTKAEQLMGYRIPIHHCSNSAALIEMRYANMDLVRAGITLYGLWPSDEVSKSIVPLRPALSFYSHIVHIKELDAGREISYGGTFKTDHSMRIATIPIGYGDGYPRGLSNKGYVLICGQKAPILGRVCMDQFMVDVTDIPEAKNGSKVTLIGTDQDETITMEQLGDLSGRFNYELSCDLGKRIPRVYLKDSIPISIDSYYC